MNITFVYRFGYLAIIESFRTRQYIYNNSSEEEDGIWWMSLELNSFQECYNAVRLCHALFFSSHSHHTGGNSRHKSDKEKNSTHRN
jgi:hypothetical protein